MKVTKATTREKEDEVATTIHMPTEASNSVEVKRTTESPLRSVFEVAFVQPLSCCRAIQTRRRARAALEATDLQNTTTTHEPEKADSTFIEKLVMAIPPFQLRLGTGDITGIKVQAILSP